MMYNSYIQIKTFPHVDPLDTSPYIDFKYCIFYLETLVGLSSNSTTIYRVQLRLKNWLSLI